MGGSPAWVIDVARKKTPNFRVNIKAVISNRLKEVRQDLFGEHGFNIALPHTWRYSTSGCFNRKGYRASVLAIAIDLRVRKLITKRCETGFDIHRARKRETSSINSNEFRVDDIAESMTQAIIV